MKIKIFVSVGEAIDKLSILIIKSKKIKCDNKLKYINQEIKEIEFSLLKISYNNFLNELILINEELWDVNEKRKFLISKNNFNQEYLELSKNESLLNDKRFVLKNNINNYFNSEIKEQKSYI